MSSPSARRAAVTRVAANVLWVALLVGGVMVVRSLTQSTHPPIPPHSRTRIVLEPVQNRSEPSQTLTAVARAHLAFCDVEVSSAIQGEAEVIDDDPLLLAVVFAPALDDTDRKQFKGCLEDWLVDNHLIHVRSIEELRAP